MAGRLCFAGNLKTNEVLSSVANPDDDTEVVVDKMLTALGYDDCVWAVYPEEVSEPHCIMDFNNYMAERSLVPA